MPLIMGLKTHLPIRLARGRNQEQGVMIEIRQLTRVTDADAVTMMMVATSIYRPQFVNETQAFRYRYVRLRRK